MPAELINRLIAKSLADQVLAAVEEMGRGSSGLVSLPALGRELGTTPAALHAAINALRRMGRLTASGHEGRHGMSTGDQIWLLAEPGSPHPIGYVSLRKAAVLVNRRQPRWNRSRRSPQVGIAPMVYLFGASVGSRSRASAALRLSRLWAA